MNKEDAPIICLFAFFFLVILSVVAAGCVDSYLKHSEMISAMERGYIQRYDNDSGKLIWVKQ